MDQSRVKEPPASSVDASNLQTACIIVFGDASLSAAIVVRRRRRHEVVGLGQEMKSAGTVSLFSASRAMPRHVPADGSQAISDLFSSPVRPRRRQMKPLIASRLGYPTLPMTSM